VRGLDYACGAGHFLTELASELRDLEPQHRPDAVPNTYDQGLYGIEKEYRLSKVAKVSAFMYGQTGTQIVYADALAQHPDIEEGSFDLLVANPPYSVKGFLETLPEAERQRYELYKRIDRKTLAKNNSIETFFVERAQQLLRPGGVAAIVLPSSILSNGKAQYVGTRELLLKFFEIVAIAQLGARTFGKTGTNTVTLFLRRKAESPTPADHYRNRVHSWFAGSTADAGGQAVYTDEYFIHQYCQHQDWELDHYKTLLAGTPNEELLAYELFTDYRRDFDKLTETKALLKNKYFKAKPAAEQEAEVTVRFIKYLRAIEQDKLYYFVLAAASSVPGTAPRPVVIVKSPSDNQAQKSFLGYDWSGAKGSEGIKYLTGGPVPKDKPVSEEAEIDENDATDENDPIENISKLSNIHTTLYDPHLRTNSAKLNYYIEQNFLGQDFTIPEELQPFLTTARLVDMLDFKRVDFDKAFSLTAKKSLRMASRWPLQKLSNLVQIISGGTPDTNRPEYWNGSIPWLSVVDFNSTDRYVSQSEKTITEAGLDGSSTRYLNVGDLIISARGTVGAIAEVAVPATFNQSCYGLRPKLDMISSGYLYYTLKEEIAQFKANAGGSKFDAITIKTFDDIVIAVPPAEVQAQIVTECEAIEAEVVAANALVVQAKEDMAAQVQEVYAGGYPTKKLSALALRNPSKSELKSVPDDTIVSFVDMAAVSNDGYIERQTLRPLRELRKGSYTYFAENDIILAKITPCMENGKSALATGLSNGLALGSSEFHVIRALDEILPGYLFTLLNRAEVRQEAERNMTGSSGHRRAPITFYENLLIPVPSIEVQEALITNLNALQVQIAEAQIVVAGAATRKQAVLQQHLQGAAVPQTDAS
jgi:type I restriction enzyme M protein